MFQHDAAQEICKSNIMTTLPPKICFTANHYKLLKILLSQLAFNCTFYKMK